MRKKVLALLCAALLFACGNGLENGDVQLGDSDEGTALMMQVGFRIFVTLNSPDWTFQEATNPAVLEKTSAVVSATATSATYHALELGTADIVATRTMCGDHACTPDEATYSITVTVGAAH
jgi:hypothetical protein